MSAGTGPIHKRPGFGQKLIGTKFENLVADKFRSAGYHNVRRAESGPWDIFVDGSVVEVKSSRFYPATATWSFGVGIVDGRRAASLSAYVFCAQAASRIDEDCTYLVFPSADLRCRKVHRRIKDHEIRTRYAEYIDNWSCLRNLPEIRRNPLPTPSSKRHEPGSGYGITFAPNDIGIYAMIAAQRAGGIEAFGERVGVGVDYLHDLIHGRCVPDDEMALKLGLQKVYKPLQWED